MRGTTIIFSTRIDSGLVTYFLSARGARKEQFHNKTWFSLCSSTEILAYERTYGLEQSNCVCLIFLTKFFTFYSFFLSLPVYYQLEEATFIQFNSTHICWIANILSPHGDGCHFNFKLCVLILKWQSLS